MHSDDNNYVSNYEQLSIEILKLTNGVISTTTYWDYAKSSKDLLGLLIDCVNCNYDIHSIRDIIGQDMINKCIKVRDFIKPNDLELFKQATNKPFRDLSGHNRVIVYPCILNIEDDITILNKLFAIANRWSSLSVEETIPIILRNRYALKLLNIPDALNIFEDLYIPNIYANLYLIQFVILIGELEVNKL